MKDKMVHIILGGTFDPVHVGHLRMAQEMLNHLPSAKVSLMPAAYPPHRDEPAASPQQRIEMLKLVTDSIDELNLDCRELERSEPSYSVVTLKEIRQEIGDNCLIFLMGTDAFAKLDQWFQWQDILTLCNILVIGRPSSELPKEGVVAELYAEKGLRDFRDLSQHELGKIGYYEMPQLDISSTSIRNQIKCGKSPRFLTPSVILDYINRNQLYRNK